MSDKVRVRIAGQAQVYRDDDGDREDVETETIGVGPGDVILSDGQVAIDVISIETEDSIPLDYEEEIETDDPVEKGIYVWDHATETVAASGFETTDEAELWAGEHGPAYEPADSRPLRESREDDEGLDWISTTGDVEDVLAELEESIENKPERDPTLCSSCDAEATTATPAGPMCADHAEELAEELLGPTDE